MRTAPLYLMALVLALSSSAVANAQAESDDDTKSDRPACGCGDLPSSACDGAHYEIYRSRGLRDSLSQLQRRPGGGIFGVTLNYGWPDENRTGWLPITYWFCDYDWILDRYPERLPDVVVDCVNGQPLREPLEVVKAFVQDYETIQSIRCLPPHEVGDVGDSQGCVVVSIHVNSALQVDDGVPQYLCAIAQGFIPWKRLKRKLRLPRDVDRLTPEHHTIELAFFKNGKRVATPLDVLPVVNGWICDRLCGWHYYRQGLCRIEPCYSRESGYNQWRSGEVDLECFLPDDRNAERQEH